MPTLSNGPSGILTTPVSALAASRLDQSLAERLELGLVRLEAPQIGGGVGPE